MVGLVLLVPTWLSWKVGGGFYTSVFFGILTTLPILIAFWLVSSRLAPRKNEKARYPGRPVEHYITFKNEKDRRKYHGKNKIPMDTFYEMYFDGDVDFNGDALEILEYRHDWVSFRFTWALLKYFLVAFLPEVIMHTRSQGKSFDFLITHWYLPVQTRNKSAITMTVAMTSTAGSLVQE